LADGGFANTRSGDQFLLGNRQISHATPDGLCYSRPVVPHESLHGRCHQR
jgi:hypothetical protein